MCRKPFITVFLLLVASSSGSGPVEQLKGYDMGATERIPLLQVETGISRNVNNTDFRPNKHQSHSGAPISSVPVVARNHAEAMPSSSNNGSGNLQLRAKIPVTVKITDTTLRVAAQTMALSSLEGTQDKAFANNEMASMEAATTKEATTEAATTKAATSEAATTKAAATEAAATEAAATEAATTEAATTEAPLATHTPQTTLSIAWIHLDKPEFLETVNLKAVAAEYLAMTLFVIIGCGSAMGVAKEPGWTLQVALSFGFAITVLGYSIGHLSGGHINCAVTFGLYMAGQVEWFQGICIFLAQLMGSVTGASVLLCIFPQDQDRTESLGSNKITEGFSAGQVLLGEGIMTFLLVFVVLETAVNPATAAQRVLACLAIGLAVFLAHSVLLPVDGCSINPTRSFGPALIACCRKNSSDVFQDMWVFWLGPLAGASLAAFAYRLLQS